MLSSIEDETQLSDPDATVNDVFVDGGRKRRAEQQPLAPGRGGATNKRGKGGRA